MPDFGDTNAILAWVGAHGPQALGVIAFVTALGVPLPITILLLADGALARNGVSDLGAAIAACFVGSLLAESVHYVLGAGAGPRLRSRTGGKSRRAWEQTETRFRQNPGMTVFLSRHVLAAIGLPVNWISGSSGYPFSRFFFWSVVGNAAWIFPYAAAGYWLGDSWQRYQGRMDVYRTWIVAITLAALAAFVLLRLARTRRANALTPVNSFAQPQAGDILE